jgi:hypothetical protein
VTAADLADVGLTRTIYLPGTALLAGHLLLFVLIRHTVPFTGGGLTSYTVSLGTNDNLTKYVGAFDVFQSAEGSVFLLTQTHAVEGFTAAEAIKITAVATGANLDAATQGELEVTLGVIDLT